MSKTDNKQAQQNHGRFHSLATHIQHHPYISLTIPSLIFIAISVTHFLISDKTLQTNHSGNSIYIGPDYRDNSFS